jgi:hypothetical protein
LKKINEKKGGESWKKRKVILGKKPKKEKEKRGKLKKKRKSKKKRIKKNTAWISIIIYNILDVNKQ